MRGREGQYAQRSRSNTAGLQRVLMCTVPWLLCAYRQTGLLVLLQLSHRAHSSLRVPLRETSVSSSSRTVRGSAGSELDLSNERTSRSRCCSTVESRCFGRLDIVTAPSLWLLVVRRRAARVLPVLVCAPWRPRTVPNHPSAVAFASGPQPDTGAHRLDTEQPDKRLPADQGPVPPRAKASSTSPTAWTSWPSSHPASRLVSSRLARPPRQHSAPVVTSGAAGHPSPASPPRTQRSTPATLGSREPPDIDHPCVSSERNYDGIASPDRQHKRASPRLGSCMLACNHITCSTSDRVPTELRHR
jgi:hypothetical protein